MLNCLMLLENVHYLFAGLHVFRAPAEQPEPGLLLIPHQLQQDIMYNNKNSKINKNEHNYATADVMWPTIRKLLPILLH